MVSERLAAFLSWRRAIFWPHEITIDLGLSKYPSSLTRLLADFWVDLIVAVLII